MKFLFSALIILLNLICVCGQEPDSAVGKPAFEKSPQRTESAAENLPQSESPVPDFSAEKIEMPEFDSKIFIEREWRWGRVLTDSETNVRPIFDETLISKKIEDFKPKAVEKEKFHWKPALIQSGVFLGIQHGFRMLQAKTRRELGGKFFEDWGTSVRRLHGWGDSDNIFTNYVAHPLQGATTGRIFVNNSDAAAQQEFGASKKYWESRLKAMIWSTVWSAQFELGPLSEASLGNVGIRDKRGRSTMALVDLVITPTVGTGVLIVEDALDRYVLKNWIEKRVRSKFLVKTFRIMLTPTTSFANVLRWKRPSWRAARPL